MIYRLLLRPILFALDPETAHHLAQRALRLAGAVPPLRWLLSLVYERATPALAREVFGLQFKNPVGLAAGFDKEARSMRALQRLGFGFLEIGAVSSQGRPGNPRPRIFRLPSDRALINRMGLPNAGAAVIAERLSRFVDRRVPLFANIVKTADLEGTIPEMAADYLVTLDLLYPHVDGFTVNVSCPASPELRSFGKRDAMFELLGGLARRRDELAAGGKKKPLVLKVSPDIDDEERDVIVDACRAHLVDGLELTNTTQQRSANLVAGADLRAQRGGLSGAPLFSLALDRVRWFAERLGADTPIIGVGGIMGPEQAQAMLDAGAALIEIYTGFVYEGPGLIKRILGRIAYFATSKAA